MSTREDLVKAIENQILENNPVIAAITLARLMNEGATRDLAISMLADALFEHMTQMLKDDEEFIEAKYADRLNRIKLQNNDEL